MVLLVKRSKAIPLHSAGTGVVPPAISTCTPVTSRALAGVVKGTDTTVLKAVALPVASCVEPAITRTVTSALVHVGATPLTLAVTTRYPAVVGVDR